MKLYESFSKNLNETSTEELKEVDRLIQELDANEGEYDIDDIRYAINTANISGEAKEAAESCLDYYDGIGGYLDQDDDDDEREETLIDANNEAENAILDFYGTDRDELGKLFHSPDDLDESNISKGNKSFIKEAEDSAVPEDVKKLIDIAENLNWNVDWRPGNLTLEIWDSSGGDFVIELSGNTADELIADLNSFVDNYDVDEEFDVYYEAGRGGLSGVPGPRALLDAMEEREKLARLLLDMFNKKDKIVESEKLNESTKFYNTEEPNCYLTLDKLQVVHNSAGKVLDVATHGLVQNKDTVYVIVSDSDLDTVKAYSVDYHFPYVFKTKSNVNESEKLDESQTLKEEEFRIPEDPSDGWGDDIEDFTQEFFDKVDAMGYEIHNAIRGSYGISGDSINMLAMDFEDVANMASSISEDLKRANVYFVSDEDFEESEKKNACNLTEDEKAYAEYLKQANPKELSNYDRQVLQKDDLVKRYMDDPDNDQLLDQIIGLNRQTANVDSSQEKNYNEYLRKVTNVNESDEDESGEDEEYEIIITERLGTSKFGSKVYDTVSSAEQASDKVGELRARGIGATYKKKDKKGE